MSRDVSPVSGFGDLSRPNSNSGSRPPSSSLLAKDHKAPAKPQQKRRSAVSLFQINTLRPDQTSAYWMEKPPSDFRRHKRMSHLERMAHSHPGLPASKSLPSLKGGSGGGGSPQGADLTGAANRTAIAEYQKEQAELEVLQKVADRRQREASLLEAKRVKLEEALVEAEHEWVRVCEDAAGKDFDFDQAAITQQAMQEEIDTLNAATKVTRS